VNAYEDLVVLGSRNLTVLVLDCTGISLYDRFHWYEYLRPLLRYAYKVKNDINILGYRVRSPVIITVMAWVHCRSVTVLRHGIHASSAKLTLQSSER